MTGPLCRRPINIAATHNTKDGVLMSRLFLPIGFAAAQNFNVIALAEANSILRPLVDAAKIWLQKQASVNNFSVHYIDDTEKIDDAFLSHYQLFIQLD